MKWVVNRRRWPWHDQDGVRRRLVDGEACGGDVRRTPPRRARPTTCRWHPPHTGGAGSADATVLRPGASETARDVVEEAFQPRTNSTERGGISDDDRACPPMDPVVSFRSDSPFNRFLLIGASLGFVRVRSGWRSMDVLELRGKPLLTLSCCNTPTRAHHLRLQQLRRGRGSLVWSDRCGWKVKER